MVADRILGRDNLFTDLYAPARPFPKGFHESGDTQSRITKVDDLRAGEGGVMEAGGKKIAGTGEMSADGVVGPIGGIRQKMRGAANAGATIFLVPQANCSEALDGDDDGLKLVKITQLADAISSLKAAIPVARAAGSRASHSAPARAPACSEKSPA